MAGAIVGVDATGAVVGRARCAGAIGFAGAVTRAAGALPKAGSDGDVADRDGASGASVVVGGAAGGASTVAAGTAGGVGRRSVSDPPRSAPTPSAMASA